MDVKIRHSVFWKTYIKENKQKVYRSSFFSHTKFLSEELHMQISLQVKGNNTVDYDYTSLTQVQQFGSEISGVKK